MTIVEDLEKFWDTWEIMLMIIAIIIWQLLKE